ncbi:MAG: hypothetical protein JXR48_17255 [Candidatus Delongbacteria bacterium]|nr:hypothetical protein [Candidatus Delongbacteria bacterium]MBN2836707.1 hypothetical protein [Candidatus Delongbacteria bacterium]
MRKFLNRVFLFLIPLFLIIVGVEVLLRFIPNEFELKKKFLDFHSNEVEVLILGHSHSYYGLNPVYFEKYTFNASNVSQSLKYDFEIISKYSKSFKSLKVIVLPISYFSIFFKLEDSIEFWRVKNYNLYFDLPTDCYNLSSNFEILGSDKKVLLRRLYNYYAINKSINCSDSGWGNDFDSVGVDDFKLSGISRSKYHTYDLNSKINEGNFNENLAYLKKIVDYCENNKIELFLFNPPTTSFYRENIDIKQLDKTIGSLNSLISESSYCRFYDLSDDTLFNINDFHDADHLSSIGAKKLSLKINNLIEN